MKIFGIDLALFMQSALSPKIMGSIKYCAQTNYRCFLLLI